MSTNQDDDVRFFKELLLGMPEDDARFLTELKFGVPEWVSELGTDKYDYKEFWKIFTDADKFGESVIRDAYQRAHDGCKDDVNYYASLVMTLCHKMWQWHRTNQPIALVYDELWKEADNYGHEYFKGEDAAYYLDFLS